jgi:hypothetical protein
MDFTKMFEYGLPTILLCAVVLGIWRALAYMAHKLFDKEEGAVPKLVSEHINFLKKTNESMEKTNESIDNQNKILENMDSRLEKIEDYSEKQVNILSRMSCANQNGKHTP